MNTLAMEAELMVDEGLRLRPYTCTAGKLTIGYGRNLDDKGISKLEAVILLRHDIAECEQQLRKALPWCTQLDDVRQRVLVNMCFNLGVTGLLSFARTLSLIKGGHYDAAATAMLQSKWSSQVGPRAVRLAAMMRTGTV